MEILDKIDKFLGEEDGLSKKQEKLPEKLKKAIKKKKGIKDKKEDKEEKE